MLARLRQLMNYASGASSEDSKISKPDFKGPVQTRIGPDATPETQEDFFNTFKAENNQGHMIQVSEMHIGAHDLEIHENRYEQVSIPEGALGSRQALTDYFSDKVGGAAQVKGVWDLSAPSFENGQVNFDSLDQA